MSHAIADSATPAVPDFEWVELDEDGLTDDDATKYGSLVEMHTAPLRLNPATEARFAAAKSRGVRRTAPPLQLG
jgi:hypothetical protein